MKHIPSIEPLEARIAPAAVLTLIDIDGDIVTITSSKGTDAQLDAAVQRVATGALGGVEIVSIALDQNPAFEGTDLSVIAKRSPNGGNGLVNVGRIDAANDPLDDFDTGRNLGKIFVDGNLKDFDAGTGAVGSQVKSLHVHSTSGNATWKVSASIGKLVVATDLQGVEIDLPSSFSIGKVKIGGSLIGEGSKKSGTIRAGEIGSLKIGGDVRGGTGLDSGSVSANAIDSVAIGGSLIGGANISSGSLFIKEIGSLSIAGSILGGAKQYSGIVESVELGTLKIRGDLRGGSGTDSGLVMASSSIGLVKIGGDLAGGSGAASGQIIVRPADDAPGTMGPVYIGGSMIGSGGYSGALFARDIQSVNVKHDVKGGTGSFSGAIMADEKLGRVGIGGSVIGGDAQFSGAITGGAGIATVSIGGDLKAGAVANAGIIFAGYDQSGGSDRAKLGAVKIKGNLLGSADVPALIFATGSADIDRPFPFVIKSITVGGNVEFARILAGYDALSPRSADASIGVVKVAGDWTASTVAAGVDPGVDQRFATVDDVAANSPTSELFSRIASIAIGGKVRGTPAANDHFGFVAQEIGSLSIAGKKFPLTFGPSNDNVGSEKAKFELGSTDDVTVREIA